jgi:hypothetical protein
MFELMNCRYSYWDFIVVPPKKLVKRVWLIFLMQWSLCALDSKVFAYFLLYIPFLKFPIHHSTLPNIVVKNVLK